MSLSNLVVNNQFAASLAMTNNPYPIGENIQSSINSSSKLQSIKANSEFTMTKQQAIFYELIRKYYKEKYSSNSEKLPYFLHKDSYDDITETDTYKNLYHTIFSEIVESILQAVGNRWTSSSAQATLQEYSNNVSNPVKLNQIIQYDEAKQIISSNYDLADYDNPNDPTIGKKQYALMAGAFHVYFRTYILEFLCRGMPFYDAFDIDFEESGDQYKFAAKYIKEMIKVDLGSDEASSFIQASDILQDSLGLTMPSFGKLNYEDFSSFCKQVINFLKEKEVITANEFSSIDKSNVDWGVQYYVSRNFMSVYELFTQEILSDAFEKLKLESFFGWQTKANNGDPTPLPVHPVGYPTENLFGGNFSIGKSVSNILWGGKSGPGQDLTDKNFSLFGTPGTSTFKRGRFFIQNYFYVVEGGTKSGGSNSKFETRSPHERGVVSKEIIDELLLKVLDANVNNELGLYDGKIPDLQGDFTLSALFSNVKMGSRLCYGVSCDLADTNSTNIKNRIFNSAKAIFGAYDVGFNDSVISNTQRQAGLYISMLDKSIVCPDGPHPNLQGEVLNFSLTDKNVELSDNQNGALNSYSIVIPFCSVERDIDMSKLISYWVSAYGGQYEEGIDFETEFKNLNSTIFNTEEYKALRNACFPMEDILMYTSIFGLQSLSFNNQPLQTALVGTKINLISSIKAIENGKKWDYLQE